MRGEHVDAPRSSLETGGSSPHARGTLCHRVAHAVAERFIPACAGNTGVHQLAGVHQTVHPRMRGEHDGPGHSRRPIGGSSPHARGTRDVSQIEMNSPRFIPACAGNTSMGPKTNTCPAVHPRMRGEHVRCRHRGIHADGSSPHARGTRIRSSIASRPQRFIPACAGNTRCRTGMSYSGTVHPRMRGEHQAPIRQRDRQNGSSPHARGTPIELDAHIDVERFIPACAGNTGAGALRSRSATVHPRMRGEHDPTQYASAFSTGSSPHARGTPQYRAAYKTMAWFIPACAGNTVAGSQWVVTS